MDLNQMASERAEIAKGLEILRILRCIEFDMHCIKRDTEDATLEYRLTMYRITDSLSSLMAYVQHLKTAIENEDGYHTDEYEILKPTDEALKLLTERTKRKYPH